MAGLTVTVAGRAGSGVGGAVGLSPPHAPHQGDTRQRCGQADEGSVTSHLM